MSAQHPVRQFFILCAVSLCVFLCAVPGLRAEENSRSALSNLQKNVHIETLDNGLRVILYRRDFAPVFAGAVTVRAGGVNERRGNTGISHMLEHMAFKGTDAIGTKNISRERALMAELEEVIVQNDGLRPTEGEAKERWDRIQKQLEELWVTGEFTEEYTRRGAVGMNATTGKELTRYFVNLPSSELEFWCWIESERLINPVMRQFYKERDVVMEERRMRYSDDPGGKIYESLLAVSYLQHPYRNPVIGFEHDLNRLTADETLAFHKKYYVPANTVVSIVGDIDIPKTAGIIKKYFGRLRRAPAPKHPSIVEPAQEGERRLTVKFEASPDLAIAYHKPQYPHVDDPAISIMLEILAGTSVSPLYTELVKKSQLAASVSYFEAPGYGYPNLVIFSATPRKPHSTETVLRAFDRVLRNFKRKGVSTAEVDRAKRSVAVEYLTHLKSNMSLALDFGSSELLYGDWRSIIDWYDQVMQVTAEDVNRVARTYLMNDTRTVVALEDSR